MEYKQDDLLRIYQLAYKHDVEQLIAQGDQKERLDLILDVAEFAYLIATNPEGESAQNMARDYVEFIDRIHASMMGELLAGSWSNPCICLHQQIAERARILQERVEQLEETDDVNAPENDMLFGEAMQWADWVRRCRYP